MGLISSSLLTSNPNKEPINDSIDLGTLTNWVAPVELSTQSDRDTNYPEIAVGADGNIHIVWADYSNLFDSDYTWDIFYRRWDATTASFTPTIWVSSLSTSAAYQPVVAVDSEGNAHIVWYDYTNVFGASGSDYDIFYRMWNKTTGTLSGHTGTYDCVTSGTNHSSNCYYPDVATDPQGNVHVVWVDYSSILESDGYADIYYKNWNATTGNWGPLVLVSDESTYIATYPSIATDSKGNVYVAWDDRTDLFNESETYDDVFYKYWNSTTGLWSETELISNESYGNAYEPSIAVDGLGNIHIAWHDTSNIYGAGTDSDIFYRMWNATTRVWSGHINNTDIVSERGGSYTSHYASIGADMSGNAYVVWEEYYFDGYSNYDTIYRMWNASTGLWESMVKVSTSAGSSYDAWRPAIDVDDGGSSYVTWNEEHSWDEIYFRKSIGSVPLAPILNPIVPNPNPNLDNLLTWTRPMEPAEFYIYKNTSFITSVDGLTPIAKVPYNSYADIITENGTYYYAIVAENEIGNSTLSNCQGVNNSFVYGFHRIRISSNADFPKYNFPGNGSQANPWIIENWYINAYGGNGIYISDTTDYFIIRNSTVFNGINGFYLKNVVNGKIINNTARQNAFGFNITYSNGIILVNNTARDGMNPIGSGFGFCFSNSDNNWIENCRSYNNDGAIDWGGVGLWLVGSSSNTFIDNYFYNNKGTGIIFNDYSDWNNLTRNRIFNNTGTLGYDHTGIGFPYGGGHYNTLEQNMIYDHLSVGIESSHCGPNYIINNTFFNNYAALDFVSSINPNWEFNYNKFFNNIVAGDLWIATSQFYKNEIWNNTNGLSFWGAGGSTLTENIAWNNTNYAFAVGADNMKLYSNTAYKNKDGFYISDLSIIADGNFAYNNTGYGFFISRDSQFTNNYAIGNDIGVAISAAQRAFLDSNVIFKNRIGIKITGSINTTVINNEIYNNSLYGMQIETTNNSVITDNTIINSTIGLRLQNTLNTTIYSNTIFNNTQNGIHLVSIIDTDITYNDILNNRKDGIYLEKGFDTVIKYNNINNNSLYGIYIVNSNNSEIDWNIVLDNYKCIEELSGINNTINSSFCFKGPLLYPITPNPSYDGWVFLDWANVPWATYYLVYRKFNAPFSNIWDIILWGTLVKNVTQSEASDNVIAVLGEYYYVIIAGNATCWTIWSNNEWVNVTGYPVPAKPTLSYINAIDYDGQVKLSWTTNANATSYYIYRNTSVITDISALTPLAVTSGGNYIDVVYTNITYYYVVVAGNPDHNSTISNNVNTTIILYPSPGIPTLDSINPSVDYDGAISLNWEDCINTINYYIYRETQNITTITGLTPITITDQSSYVDSISLNGTYYYVVLAGNPTLNSSITSNCVNVSVIMYPTILTPILNPLKTSSYDGLVTLTWSGMANTVNYYIYRETSYITNITGLIPVGMVLAPQLSYTNVVVANGTFFYVVVAGNPSHNSSISNSRSVTVTLYPPPSVPSLYPINGSNNGIVSLNWSNTVNTVRYYIYRDNSEIFDVSGLTPLAITSQSRFIDNTITINGTYFYAIVAGNPSYNSTISNSMSVDVVIYLSPEPGTDDDWLWIVIIIVVAAVASVTTLYVFRMRSKSRVAPITSSKSSKMVLGEVRRQLKDASSSDQKLRVLQDNGISIETIPELYDETLNKLISQHFTTPPIKLLEFLQRADMLIQDKLEIIQEFNNLSETKKKEFLDELSSLL